MRGQPAISTIWKQVQSHAAADPFEEFNRIERMRRLAWQRCGVVAVQLADLPEDLRDQMRSHMEGLYGPR
jgi:hypothetical protein